MRTSAVIPEGTRFLKIVTLESLPSGFRSDRPAYRCKCDCGAIKFIEARHLLSGGTRSCGCWQAEEASKRAKTHGRTRTPEYWVWASMRQRCYDKNTRNYHRYGGRGITVCDRWRHSFNNFYADMGKRPEGYSIDRIDNDRGYSPDNCRWISSKENCRNQERSRMITWRAKTQCLSAWAEELGIPMKTLHFRLTKGWAVDKALATPVRQITINGVVRHAAIQ